MPATQILHVALTEPLVQHVRDQVAAGRSETAGEAVRRALQLPIERDATIDRSAVRSSVVSAHGHG